MTTQEQGLRLEGVHAAYHSSPVLRDVSLHAHRGQVVGIVGPNGAGKTTLLKSIMGLEVQTRGRVWLDGERIDRLRPHQRARRGLWLIPDNRGIFQNFSVQENLKLAATKSTGDLSLATNLFPWLRDRLKQRAGMLSGGEQQMLGVARALLSERSVIMVDEPSLGLAPVIADRVFDAVRQVASAGRVVVVAEQNSEMVVQIADVAHLISHGALRTYNDPRSLHEDGSAFQVYLGLRRAESSMEG